MTEQEWLSSDDPEEMMRTLNLAWAVTAPDLPDYIVSDHKLRQWVFACRNVEDSQRRTMWFDKELASRAELHSCVKTWSSAGRNTRYVPFATRAALLREIVGNPWRPVQLPKCGHCDGDGKRHGSDRPFEWTPEIGYPGKCLVCGGSGLDVPWLTPTVLNLARAAYEERVGEKCRQCEFVEASGYAHTDFESHRTGTCRCCHGTGTIAAGHLDPARLAVLAGALEEAGCCEEAMLRHLRGEERYLVMVRPKVNLWGWRPLRGPHVRGCWALDLLLGKE